jgi:hypothetical protein
MVTLTSLGIRELTWRRVRPTRWWAKNFKKETIQCSWHTLENIPTTMHGTWIVAPLITWQINLIGLHLLMTYPEDLYYNAHWQSQIVAWVRGIGHVQVQC